MSHNSPAESGAPAPRPPRVAPEDRITRASALWVSLIGGFLVLIGLLTFVAQNTESVTTYFWAWSWSMPLGVAILLAAVAGGLVTATVGTIRIYQLRRVAKKNLSAGRAH